MSLGVVRDILESKPFQAADMTEAVNDIIPYKPGQIGALGVFREESLFTDVAYIEERQGVLSLIPTSKRGEPSTQIKPVKRNIRLMQTLRLSEEDQINASELFKVTQFHTGNAALQNLATVRDQRLGLMADAMDVTHEHMLLNTVKGVLVDADASTLLSMFTLFGVTQETEVAFDLTSSTAGKLAGTLATIKRKIMNTLEADAARLDHIHIMCSPEFFDDLITKNIDIAAWAKVPPNSDYLRTSRVFGAFQWQGFIFEEYRLGTIGAGIGGSWIDADKCVIFPVGPSIYTTFYSPGEYFGALGTAGIPRYARAAVDDDWDEFIRLRLQSYPLPICSRPKTLMKGKRGA